MSKKFNILDIHSEGRRLVDCSMVIICPYCMKAMFWAYLRDRVCYCKSCKKVFEITMKESKASFEDLNKDGWGKE